MSNKQILIEQDEQGRVNVTTNEESLSVESALLLLKLAELNVLSYYLGGQEEPEPQDADA